MREHVDALVWNYIFARAAGNCECTNPSCPHPPGRCDNAIGNRAGVALPDNTPRDQQVALGRLMCALCFARTPSYIRQRGP
jgi:hypothetical protein